MRLLLAAIIAAIATDCCAEQTWKPAGTNKVKNFALELDESSVESIGGAEVRALARVVRAYPNKLKSGSLPSTVESSEMRIEFDCERPRFKVLQETRVTFSGQRVPMLRESTPTYEDAQVGSPFDQARVMACKAGGKMPR